jgi:hypothetical protein
MFNFAWVENVSYSSTDYDASTVVSLEIKIAGYEIA